jgi:DNA-binding GntR family transcriptional regulator
VVLLDARKPDARLGGTPEDRVFDWLAEQIVTGSLRPGQWISENEVASQLGISRSPVRDAFRSFAREGLVTIHPRRGTVMAELDAEDADDLYRTRALIEPEMVRMSVEQMAAPDIAEAAVIADEIRAAVGDPTAFYDALLHLYQLLIDLCPSATIRDFVATLWRRSMRFRGLSIRIPTWQPQKNTVKFADRFVELARAGDAEGAKQALTELLDQTRHHVLEHLFVDVYGQAPVPRTPIVHGANDGHRRPTRTQRS